MSLVRIVQTAQVTLTHVFKVDETPTDAAGTVAATLKRLDGTVVNTATATHTVTGTYTYTVPGQPLLDSLTLDWTGTVAGAAVSVRDYVEIVGGHLFDLGEARTALGLSAATYPASTLAARRIEVEQEFERICGRAFVPRFGRAVVSGRGTERLAVPDKLLRSVRAVTVSGTAWSPTEVAAVGVTDGGMLVRPTGAIWPIGVGNVVVEYEHGMDFPPAKVSEMGILRLRSNLGSVASGVPDRAISFTAAEGGTYRLSTPSKQRTGIPDVDGVLERYSRSQRSVIA